MLVSETPLFLASFDFPELFRQTQTDTSLLGILFDIYAEDLVLAACAPTSTKPRSVHGRGSLGAYIVEEGGVTWRWVMWVKTKINCGLGDGLLLFYHVVPT